MFSGGSRRPRLLPKPYQDIGSERQWERTCSHLPNRNRAYAVTYTGVGQAQNVTIPFSFPHAGVSRRSEVPDAPQAFKGARHQREKRKRRLPRWIRKRFGLLVKAERAKLKRGIAVGALWWALVKCLRLKSSLGGLSARERPNPPVAPLGSRAATLLDTLPVHARPGATIPPMGRAQLGVLT